MDYGPTSKPTERSQQTPQSRNMTIFPHHPSAWATNLIDRLIREGMRRKEGWEGQVKPRQAHTHTTHRQNPPPPNTHTHRHPHTDTDRHAPNLGELPPDGPGVDGAVKGGGGGGGGGVVLTLSDDAQLSVAACLWCTGAAAPAWLGSGPSPPRLTPDGFVAVGADLASPAAPSLFAAGDCAAVLPHPRPKAGVFAVRQGPALTENLLAALAGRAPREFTPQATALSLLSLGWRSGVGIVPVAGLSSTPLVVQGRWVWVWKDWIDRRFVRRYQR